MNKNLLHTISKIISNNLLTPKNLLRVKSNPKSGQFRTLLLFFILFFCGISMLLVKSNAEHSSTVQEGIAENIIRFHVIANSDSTEDQSLKLKVKDELVKSLSPLLDNATSISDARAIIVKHLDFIQEIAETKIQEYGYHYPVKVSLADCYFPLKLYGNCTFPPGTYEALRVQIGAAEGKNWWCVMFPPLCFVDETYSVVDKGTNAKLKHILTEEEYDTLINQKKPIKVKFKLWESIKDLFK